MPVILEDRPIEKVKEEVIDILVHNYSHGFISAQAFERRLDVVIESTSHQEMVKQIEDLDDVPDETIRRHKEQQFSVNYHDTVVQDSEFMISVFGGAERSGQWAVPKTITVVSIFGGADIDFTDARFSSPNVTIKMFGLFSGDNIYVPENVNVVSKVFCIFGGVSNKSPSIGPRHAPTITIEGWAIFTGIDIKVRTTMKEKFVAFANQMKSMFDTRKSG